MLQAKRLYRNPKELIEVSYIERYYVPDGLGYSSVYVVTCADLTRVYSSANRFKWADDFDFLSVLEFDMIFDTIRAHEIRRERIIN